MCANILYIHVALFELHGNSNLERCDKCGHEYLRDFRCSVGLRNHLTGRKCDDVRCGGSLKDTIIHFGETLPVGEFTIIYKSQCFNYKAQQKLCVCCILSPNIASFHGVQHNMYYLYV